MKRLLITLSIFVSCLVLGGGTALAEHYWEVKMSDPTTATQPRTFTIDYVAMSTESTDQITVRLLQNATVISSQVAASSQGGNSGVFTVTVPADGTYTYQLSATSSIDGNDVVRTTPAKNVNVSTQAGVTTITVSNAPAGTGGGTAANNASTTGGGAGGGTGTGTGGTGTGSVEGEQTTEGTVGEEGAVSQNTEGEVLGEETTDSDGGSNTGRNVAIVAAVLAALGGVYYWFFYRQGASAGGGKKGS